MAANTCWVCGLTPLCNPRDCSTPGFPVHHQLPELAQTHVHRVGDAIQPSHPLSSPSPPTFNLPASGSFLMSRLFASGGQSTGVSASASVLPMNIQDWFLLAWTSWISLQPEEVSRVFSNTTVQKQQLFGAQPTLWSNSGVLGCLWAVSANSPLTARPPVCAFQDCSNSFWVSEVRSNCTLPVNFGRGMPAEKCYLGTRDALVVSLSPLSVSLSA